MEITNPTLFESEDADIEDLAEMVHIRVDHDQSYDKKVNGAYRFLKYSTLKELTKDPLVSFHEVFHLDHGRLVIDVDCERIRDSKYFNLDFEVLKNKIVKNVLMSPLLLNQSKLTY